MMPSAVLVALAPLALGALVATKAGVKTPAPPPAPAPQLTLVVAPVSPVRWTLRIENGGPLPLHLVADPRLLSLELERPPATADSGGRPGTVKPRKPTARACALPADGRPDVESARTVVLQPGKAYVASFDPRFTCFDQPSPLVEGATMVAHYGWPGKAAPYVVTAMPPADPKGWSGPPLPASLREIVSAPLTLGASAVSASLPPSPTPAHAPESPDTRLEITGPTRLDAVRASEVTATITVTNAGARPATLTLRPQAIGFEVIDPHGNTARCGASGVEPIRELLTTLQPRARGQVTVMPAANCPERLFDKAGIYEVRPRLDTRRSAPGLGAAALFAGEVTGPSFLLRLRRGRETAPSPPAQVE